VNATTQSPLRVVVAEDSFLLRAGVVRVLAVLTYLRAEGD
jgi:hypothetical protein